MFKNLLKNTDYVILILVFLLFLIGIVGIYSAGYNTNANKTEYIKQIVWFVGMFGVGILVWAIDYRMFDLGGYLIYAVSAVLLILVLFTSPILGASSWFKVGGFLYQPSEFMKIGFILVFSKLLTSFTDNNKKNIWIKIIGGSLLFLIPFVLILLQPDFGTAAVFLAITLFILFVNKIKYRYIIIGILLAAILIPVIYFFVLNNVQQERILVFLDPSRDPLGSGYNAIQAKIAVGSGMIFGTGYLGGIQTQLGYLPIKSSDFIFASISEELGFFVSTAIVILYTILILRLFYVCKNTKDNFAKLIIAGITGMITFHYIQNIGMTLGFLPITGVPLPFVSYGGSSMMTNVIAISIILNITARKSKNVFLA